MHGLISREGGVIGGRVSFLASKTGKKRGFSRGFARRKTEAIFSKKYHVSWREEYVWIKFEFGVY